MLKTLRLTICLLPKNTQELVAKTGGENTKTILHFANRAEKNSTLLAVVSKAVDLMRTILID